MSTADDFISSLDDPFIEEQLSRKSSQVEIVVDKKTGVPRQAGSSHPEGEAVKQFREKAESSLYVFTKGVLGLDRLSVKLHREVCLLAQRLPPFRKLFLLPRDHLKTSIFSRGMPIHILIQPKDKNVYRPGKEGASTRILLSNETSTNAEHFLRWIEGRFENSQLLRAFWPHCCWGNVRKDAKKWNEKEMTIPRKADFPEASIETIGVGGAITSRHYDVLIKDDLVSIEAANSPTVMQEAIRWHVAARALMDDPDKSLEYVVGTRWAAFDIYSFIMTGGALDGIDHVPDDSVEPYCRSAIEDGESIFPEMFSLPALLQIQREMGPVLFSLLYMNSAVNPELVDFAPEDLRTYVIEDGCVVFEEDTRDATLAENLNRKVLGAVADVRGMPLNGSTYSAIFQGHGRGEWFRLRSA